MDVSSESMNWSRGVYIIFVFVGYSPNQVGMVFRLLFGELLEATIFSVIKLFTVSALERFEVTFPFRKPPFRK